MKKPALTKKSIAGVDVLTPDVHREYRGEIYSLYNQEHYQLRFVEDKISYSRQGVLRGLHGDDRTTKLVSCLHGSAYLVVVDARPASPTFGDWDWVILSDRDRCQVIIPPGVLNGHVCLSADCTFWYKIDVAYAGQAAQKCVRWDDKFLNINWPIRDPILSPFDRTAPSWEDCDWSANVFNRIVAVSGYFNPLHAGHLDLLEAAAVLGNRLVVIVNSDSQVALKGSRKFLGQEERLKIISSLKMVDTALIAIDGDRSVCRTLELIRPGIFANGGDVTMDNVREKYLCERLGIKMVFGVGGGKTQSSSSILEQHDALSSRHSPGI